MDPIEKRPLKTFNDLDDLEGEVFEYLALRDHRRKLIRELKKTNNAIKQAHKDSPQLMNIIGDIDRLQRKRDGVSNSDSGSAEGEIDEDEAKQEARERTEKRRKEQQAKKKRQLEKGNQSEPKRAKAAPVTIKGKAQLRLLDTIAKRESRKSDKDQAKTDVQPPKG